MRVTSRGKNEAEGNLKRKGKEDSQLKNADGKPLQHQDNGYWNEVTDYLSHYLGEECVEKEAEFSMACLSAICNLSDDDSNCWAATTCEFKKTKNFRDLLQCSIVHLQHEEKPCTTRRA